MCEENMMDTWGGLLDLNAVQADEDWLNSLNERFMQGVASQVTVDGVEAALLAVKAAVAAEPWPRLVCR